MPVIYTLHQINRSFKDGRKDSANGKWFAKTQMLGTANLMDIAEIIQRNCSMKKSDVVAVLTELVEVMTDKLQESYAVKLDGFGTFKIGIKCKGALEAEDFSVTNNIVGAHVNFTPEMKVDTSNGQRTKYMIQGATFREAPKNAVGVVTD